MRSARGVPQSLFPALQVSTTCELNYRHPTSSKAGLQTLLQMLPQSDETSVPDCSESDTADSRLASGFIYEEDEKRTSRDWSDWDEFSVALPLIERNNTFYFSLVTFRVGNQLFRVPRERFANFSEVFRDMFAIDASSTVPHEGDSDDNPIHLEGVEEGAFEDLLHLLYPECLKASDTSTPDDENSLLRWERVLALSHMWEFHNIRRHAISKLEGFEYDGVSRAQLAQKYDISSWYMPAYMALAKRKQPLTVAEAASLGGLEFAVKMSHIREARLTSRSDDKQLRRDIRKMFKVFNSTTEFAEHLVSSKGNDNW